MAYLFVAYLILWGITFGYLFYLGSRQKQLQRDVALLIEERQASSSSTREGL